MTEEYFKHMEELQRKEAEARLQRENMYSQMQAEYNNLKSDNIQQSQRITELQNKNKVTELRANQFEQENLKLKATIVQLQNELEKSRYVINDISARGSSDIPHVLIEHNFEENEEYKKKEKKLEDTIKELQDKLGKRTVPLSVLAEGLMEYAEEVGISKAHDLFNHLNTLLISVPAWINNVPELREFFKKARKEMHGAQIPPIDNHGQVNILTGKDAKAPYNPKEDDSE